MPAVLPYCQRFQLHLPVRNVALREVHARAAGGVALSGINAGNAGGR
jgi:hypothetical protein